MSDIIFIKEISLKCKVHLSTSAAVPRAWCELSLYLRSYTGSLARSSKRLFFYYFSNYRNLKKLNNHNTANSLKKTDSKFERTVSWNQKYKYIFWRWLIWKMTIFFFIYIVIYFIYIFTLHNYLHLKLKFSIKFGEKYTNIR